MIRILFIVTLLSSVIFATNYTFTCTCDSDLSSAFNLIQNTIVKQNLKPINDNLKNYNKRINEETNATNIERMQVVVSNKALALKLVEAKHYLFILQQKIKLIETK